MAEARNLTPERVAGSESAADPSERLLLAAAEAGLAGDAGRMQQLLRRSMRRPPEGLAARHPDLVEALLLAASRAVPPTPGEPAVRRGLVDAWQGPQPVPGLRFPMPDSASGRFAAPAPSAVPAGLPDCLLPDQEPAHEPSLPPEARRAVDRLVAEHTSGLLERHGLTPTRTVLLTGPPGTGKTMTARWIASRLAKPLLVLDLAALMSNELGRSAQNLSEALDAAQRARSVLFIDEFDAVASARSGTDDVGEARRLVNVLLMRLDRWPPGELLLAATNHPELLDRAVGRRFETTIDLPVPDRPARAGILQATLPDLPCEHAEVLAAVTEGRSGSDLATAARHAAREAALEERPPTLADVAAHLRGADGALPRKVRDEAIAALSSYGMPTRAIGEAVGVSHVTVAKVLKAPHAGTKETSGRRGGRRAAQESSTLAG